MYLPRGHVVSPKCFLIFPMLSFDFSPMLSFPNTFQVGFRFPSDNPFRFKNPRAPYAKLGGSGKYAVRASEFARTEEEIQREVAFKKLQEEELLDAFATELQQANSAAGTTSQQSEKTKAVDDNPQTAREFLQGMMKKTQNIMWNDVGVLRTPEGMEKAGRDMKEQRL